jgi:hypothetical protein
MWLCFFNRFISAFRTDCINICSLSCSLNHFYHPCSPSFIEELNRHLTCQVPICVRAMFLPLWTLTAQMALQIFSGMNCGAEVVWQWQITDLRHRSPLLRRGAFHIILSHGRPGASGHEPTPSLASARASETGIPRRDRWWVTHPRTESEFRNRTYGSNKPHETSKKNYIGDFIV